MTPSQPGRRAVRLTAALSLILVAVLSGCANGGADPAGSGAASMDPTFNEADVKFAQTMIPHHEQAVEMSDMLLGRSDVPPDLAQLAQQVNDTQRPQMNTMNDLLAAWKQPLIPRSRR